MNDIESNKPEREKIKLINEDADSFARRLEMYYKKRPEIMQLGQEIEPHNPDISTFFS